MSENTNRFLAGLKTEDALNSRAITENGAIGYGKTKKRLVDFFFQIGSMRNWDEGRISTAFAEAYAEDPQRAIETMFLARDCRGGQGEKRVFEICFDWLVRNYPGDANDVLHLIPEYGSWKTFFALTDSFRKNETVEKEAQIIYLRQFNNDIQNCLHDKSISLMGKWCPSENTSSRKTRQLAAYWRNVTTFNSKKYRQTLSVLRKKIQIVERDMAANNWSEINYNAVPAKAGMIYREAFKKHDPERRQAWLDSLKKNDGTAKINTAGLTVADMVRHYLQNYSGWGRFSFTEEDPTIEAAWRDLVAKHQLPENAPDMLPVIDGSGSMFSGIANSNIQPIHVSIGLGLFLANINRGAFKGKAIEYGSFPQFFEVPTEASLLEQIKIAIRHNDCGSTNVEAVMTLVLQTAVRNHLDQKEIPQLIVFSDMEFNMAMCEFDNEKALFDVISDKFNAAGYLLPKMYFWNICNRSGAIPMIENENGVGLLSGFSQAIMDMVLSQKLDPYQILLDKLNSKRYDPVRQALGIK